MKKLLPYLRLALFCIVLFAIGGVVVMLKQGRLLAKEHAEGDATAAATEHGDAPPADGEHAAGPDGRSGPGGPAGPGGEVKAALPGIGDGAEHAASSSAGVNATPSGPDEAKRMAAVTSGRALFQVPEPISIAEATDLLNELRRQKQENERRKSALDQREKELETMEKDLEARRNQMIAQADQLKGSLPAAGAKNPADEVDPATVAKLGKILEGMLPDAAAKTLATYTPERAAQVLLAMKESKASAVLGQIREELLAKITDALYKQKITAAGE